MPKISRNILGEYNKSCSTHHKESSKIQFAIFRIFYDFLENLQQSAKSFYYWSYPFATGPLTFLIPYNHTLTSSSRVPVLSQSVHRGPRRRKGARRRRGAAGPGQQARWGGGRAHLEAIGCGGGVGENTGELRRRGRGCAAGAARISARCGGMCGNWGRWRDQGVLEDALEVRVATEMAGGGGAPAAARGGGWRRCQREEG
jgi:hypothetical protein